MNAQETSGGRGVTPRIVIRRNAADSTTTIRIVPAEFDLAAVKQTLSTRARAIGSVVMQTLICVHGWFKSQQAKKRLHVCETVSLGEKRFIAVVEVDGDQFLVGGSSSSVSMLAHLEPQPAFADVLGQSCKADRNLA